MSDCPKSVRNLQPFTY